MRKIDTIIIHCSATPPSSDIGATEIRRWHKRRGWRDIGYHYVIRRNGVLESGRRSKETGAHARGHNATSLGICLIGGVSERTAPEGRNAGRDMGGRPRSNYTEDQWGTLQALVRLLMQTHDIKKVIGHNEVSRKSCPCFDVQKWLDECDIDV